MAIVTTDYVPLSPLRIILYIYIDIADAVGEKWTSHRTLSSQSGNVHVSITAALQLIPPLLQHLALYQNHDHLLIRIFSNSNLSLQEDAEMSQAAAQKRLLVEYRNITNDPPEGITAGPSNEDDMFVWEALIQGPEGTPFEGGIFPAELKFPRDYPLSPPTMRFTCELWHPNGECEFCSWDSARAM